MLEGENRALRETVGGTWVVDRRTVLVRRCPVTGAAFPRSVSGFCVPYPLTYTIPRRERISSAAFSSSKETMAFFFSFRGHQGPDRVTFLSKVFSISG